MKKGCLVGSIAAFVLLSAFLAYYFISKNKSVGENTRTVKAEYTDIIKKVVATGEVKPRQEINVKPQVSGVIEELFVEAGEMVKKGQRLAKIKLVPTQISINQAQNQVAIAKLRVENAQREFNRQKEVSNRNLDIDQAKSSFENARKELDRQTKLFEAKVISEQEYNRFKLDYELKKSTLDNAKISASNTLKSVGVNVDIAKQEYRSALANLRLLKDGIDQNSRQVSNLVTATVDGMVLDVPIEIGSSVIERNNFNEGTTIAIIADMSRLMFEGKVDEADVGSIREGMNLALKVGAIPDQSFDGVLEFISPKGVKSEGTVQFEVRASVVEDSTNFLRAGYSANGDIIIAKTDNVLSIKERDILYEEDKSYVEIKKGDGFEKIEVKTNLSDGLNTEVISGVDTTMQIRVQQEKPEEEDEER